MPFKNQSLTVLVNDLREKLEQPVRHNYTSEERQQMCNDVDGACQECSTKKNVKYINIDHIIPLCVVDQMSQRIYKYFEKCHFVQKN